MNFSLPSLVYFHSSSFIFFYLIVFFLHWLLPQRYRNFLLLAASYLFYASWDYRFFPLLFFSTLINFICVKKIVDFPSRKKLFFFFCIGSDLLFLVAFKYTNFFLSSGVAVSNFFGLNIDGFTLHLILPLGISFYTFQTLSYSIDAYKGRLKPERNFFDFALFVSFFPQLIAGPIERAADLLPQLKIDRFINNVNFQAAIYLFVYGLFKKRVLGDYLALFVRDAFDTPDSHGFSVILGSVAYTLQAFCDISGYTDMARGLAMGLGIKLMKNFDFPFFLKNPAEFWNRWHISLSLWVKHYVYVPALVRFRSSAFAVAIAFVFVSLWYGTHLHFLFWGLYWTLIVLFTHYFIQPRRFSRWLSLGVGYPLTLIAVVFGMTIFRTADLNQWMNFMYRASQGLTFEGIANLHFYKLYFCFTFLIFYEFVQFKRGELFLLKSSFHVQTFFYVFLYFFYRNLGNVAALDFIYFGY